VGFLKECFCDFRNDVIFLTLFKMVKKKVDKHKKLWD